MRIEILQNKDEKIILFGKELSWYSPIEAFGHVPSPYKESADPWRYLRYAKLDASSGEERGNINAVSNVKKSIHLQVELLLNQIGLYRRAAQDKWSFPKRTQILREVGLVPSSLLDKVNSLRNIVEHEYVAPDISAVNESIDICELVLMATNGYMRQTIHKIRFGIKNECKDYICILDSIKDSITTYEIIGTKSQIIDGVPVFVEHIFKIRDGDKLNDGLALTKNTDMCIDLLKSEEHKCLQSLGFFAQISRTILLEPQGASLTHFFSEGEEFLSALDIEELLKKPD